MIQKTNVRSVETAVTSPQASSSNSAETPDQHWGSWSGTKHYSLEVVQHPQRARMCGFGDKDRRPLAPAAVAKMVIQREDNTVVDVDDIDIAFFVVTVDLWSADGKHEMNLVLHPSSTDRYVPTLTNKSRRRGNGSHQHQRSDPPSQVLPTPSSYHTQKHPFSGHPPAPSDVSFPASYSSHPDQSPSWSYPPPPPPPGHPASLPPIHTFNRGNASGMPAAPSWQLGTSSRSEHQGPSFRGWNPDPNNHPPTILPPPASSHNDSHSQSRYPSSSYNSGPIDNTPVYATAPYGPQHSPSDAPYTPPSPPPRSSSISLTRHTYTRTLVGPLSANACRLLDEHRKPGVFFLFQDLSIRTEGTFRLRLRLMNVGALPAPEPGAMRVHTGISPILAQTFTDPFTVFSAKRFPGVPDTTALSIAFGNQGQKLPLRNRHGSRQQSSGKRRRGDSPQSDEDGSDGEEDS